MTVDCCVMNVYSLITQPVSPPCSFLFTSIHNNQPLDIWKKKMASNLSRGGGGCWLRWEHSLGPTELGTAGIQAGLWQGRLVAAKVVRKMSENVWNSVQRYAGGKKWEMQQFTAKWEHMGGEDWTHHSHFSVITGKFSMDKNKKLNNQLRNMA